jgi:hypothetical protein
MIHRSSFGGQRSIQLSYGCVGLHLADWFGLGNGPAGAASVPLPLPTAEMTSDEHRLPDCPAGGSL